MLRSILCCAVVAVTVLSSGCGSPKKDDPTTGDCTGRLTGDLVITEFLPDPAGADEGKEYIEIFNASTQVIQLQGMTLRHSRADGTAEKKTNLTKGTINPGDYYVVGDVRDANLPGYLNDTYGDGLGSLSNTNGKIAVLCGTSVLDEITYTITKEKSARILDGAIFPDSAANDDESRWCNATDQSADFFGSPRAKNASCVKTTCAGRNAGDLVITEFMPNPSGTDDGNEYIEVYNTTGAAIDLEGVSLKYSRADGSSPKEAILTGGSVPAGKYFTLGDVRTAVLPAHIDASYGAALGALGNVDGILSFNCGLTVVDEIRYTRVKDGASRVLDGNIAPPSAIDNDDEGSWCDAKVPFGTGFGSPRGANEPCGSTTAGCIDPVTNMLRTPAAPTAGKLFVTEVMADPASPTGTTSTDREWFELYATEAMDLNGVQIHRVLSSGSLNRVTLTAETCLAVTAQSYSVIARQLTPTVNGGIASPVATFNFSLVPTDTLYVSYNGALIDQATYPNATGTGVSAAFSSDRLNAQVNDSEYAWCDGTAVYGSGGKGTPGSANAVCPAAVGPGECREGGTADGGFARELLRPDGGSVVITEVMASPRPLTGQPNDRPKEWFEITAVNAPVDLNEVEVSNELGEKASIKQAACFSLQPGEFMLFGQDTDPNNNGGLPTPRVIIPFELANTSTPANTERSVSVRSQGVVVDKFAWTTSTLGASMQLSSLVAPTPQANDVPANRCDAPTSVPYGDAGTPDYGTPAAANVACP